MKDLESKLLEKNNENAEQAGLSKIENGIESKILSERNEGNEEQVELSKVVNEQESKILAENKQFSKHKMILTAGIIIMSNIFSSIIFFGSLNRSTWLDHMGVLFYISLFFYLSILMLSLLFSALPELYKKHFTLRYKLLSFFIVFLFNILSGVYLGIGATDELHLFGMFIYKMFSFGVITILAYGFKANITCCLVFCFLIALPEGIQNIDTNICNHLFSKYHTHFDETNCRHLTKEDFYSYTIYVLVYVTSNIVFLIFVRNYGIFKFSVIPKNTFFFLAFTLSLIANGGLLRFISDLILQKMVGNKLLITS